LAANGNRPKRIQNPPMLSQSPQAFPNYALPQRAYLTLISATNRGSLHFFLDK
jgi:hypothetical protein